MIVSQRGRKPPQESFWPQHAPTLSALGWSKRKIFKYRYLIRIFDVSATCGSICVGTEYHYHLKNEIPDLHFKQISVIFHILHFCPHLINMDGSRDQSNLEN